MALKITADERENMPNHEHLLDVLDRIVALVNTLESRIDSLER